MNIFEIRNLNLWYGQSCTLNDISPDTAGNVFEGLYANEAYLTALVLLVVALLVNFASGAIASFFTGNKHEYI